jgi:hypothetical protein
VQYIESERLLYVKTTKEYSLTGEFLTFKKPNMNQRNQVICTGQVKVKYFRQQPKKASYHSFQLFI